jgi:spoIIIJ-associated protein
MSVDSTEETKAESVNEELATESLETPAEETPSSKVSRLEEEGDVAADYLEELLDIADIDGDIDIEVRNGRTYISIAAEGESESLDSLVGQDGEVLEALQELARLSVLSATENRSRLVLDINGYRKDRAGELQQVAEDAVAKVKETGATVALEPMSAYERKIVHDAVAELGFVSESEGEGAGRHIVVSAD